MFDNPYFDNHETVTFVSDEASGLEAIVAVHNTHLGPSLGGCRVWTYDSPGAALDDALRLSRGMTYKAAMADLPLGGGKSVILMPPGGRKTTAMFEALGRAIERLSGSYIAAEDVGSTPDDMLAIRRHTRHVTGLAPEHGGVGAPSPTTSDGCFIAVEATAAAIGRDLSGLTVAIQGLGAVGYGLAEQLAAAGVRLIVADIDAAAVMRAVDELGATAVAPDEILTVEADILSPNALGGILNGATIPALRVAAIAGGANNQLATPEDGETLRKRGILYAPDYVVNAGGVIKMCEEYYGWSAARVRERVEGIATRLGEIFAESASTAIPTNVVADQMAEQRFKVPARHALESVE